MTIYIALSILSIALMIAGYQIWQKNTSEHGDLNKRRLGLVLFAIGAIIGLATFGFSTEIVEFRFEAGGR